MKLLSFLKKDLLLLLRDRAQMAVLFLMPLAFILPISFALGKGDGYGVRRNDELIPLPVVNYDGGPRAQELLTAVGASLRLEINHEEGLIRSLGLSDDPDCSLNGFQEAPVETTTAVSTTAASGTDLPGTPQTPGATAEGGTPEAEVTGEPETPTAGSPTAGSQTGTPAAETGTPESTTMTPAAGTPSPEATATALGDGEAQAGTISPLCSEKIAQALLQRSARTAALIIPPGFSENIDTGRRTWVTLLYDPTGDPIQLQQVEGVVKGSTMEVSLKNQVSDGLAQMVDLAAFAPEDLRAEVEKQASEPVARNQRPALDVVEVEPVQTEPNQTPDTYQQTIPGYTVMFVFFIIPALAGSLRQERLLGTFRRLLSMPVSRFELLGSKLLASIVIGMAQVGILFFVGVVLFDLHLGQDFAALFFLSLALVAAATSMGLAASTTRSRGSGLGAPLIISALLGGAMFPIDLMPPVMQVLSYFVPHRWAIQGFQDVMVRGLDMGAVLPNIGVLLAFAIVFFLIAIYRFEFEE